MTLRLSTGLRNGMLGSVAFTEAFAAGVIEIYSGPQPQTADSAVTGTLLGLVTKDAGAFVPGSPTNGLTWAAPAGGTVSKSTDNWKFVGLAAGTAGWFRLKGNAVDAGLASTVLPRMDGSVGSAGTDLVLSNITVAVGAPCTIDVFAFSIPAQ